MRHRVMICSVAGSALLAAAALAEAPPGLPRAITDADYPAVRPGAAELGQLLFYDPILSGNEEVACATCHHPAFGTGDGVSLALGDGGIGLGPERVADPANLPEQRVPRNSQALWNVGALDYRSLFHDGRVEQAAAHQGGMRTPLEEEMTAGFDSMLSAQTMFPVLSPDEMAGHYAENPVARAVRQGLLTGPGGAWDLIARRVAAIPGYADRFEAVYGLAPEEIGFTDVSNAVAAFVATEFRSDTSPFDAWLRGAGTLPEDAKRGLELFYGPAGCGTCHSGPFQTDHGFHAMGEPQFGPGKGARFESGATDQGRFEVTGDPADLYAFRTPSLRNVELTAPYGHSGAHRTLEGLLRHHADPRAGLAVWDRGEAILAPLDVADWRDMDAPDEVAAIAAAVEAAPVALSDADIADLAAFLRSLTDPVAQTGRLGIPAEVPSGLRVPMP